MMKNDKEFSGNKKIDCPHCGKEDTWYLKNRFKPFCSARCKLIDLGEWASESRKIPGESIDVNQSSDESNGDDEMG